MGKQVVNVDLIFILSNIGNLIKDGCSRRPTLRYKTRCCSKSHFGLGSSSSLDVAIDIFDESHSCQCRVLLSSNSSPLEL